MGSSNRLYVGFKAAQYMFMALAVLTLLFGVFVAWKYPSYDQLCSNYKSPDYYTVNNNITMIGWDTSAQQIRTMFCVEKSNTTKPKNLLVYVNPKDPPSKEYSNFGYIKIETSKKMLAFFEFLILCFLVSTAAKLMSRTEIGKFEKINYWAYFVSDIVWKIGTAFLVAEITIFVIIGGAL